MQIIPSILVQSEEQFINQIQNIQNQVKTVQLDIADGIFVKNKTWADPDVVKYETHCDIELHLMVVNPLEELKRWQAVEQVIRILIHYESVDDLADIMPTLHAYGWEIGIVLNPDTSIDVLEPYIDDIKCVQFMTVYPGKQGQTFISDVLEKIKKFHQTYPDMPIAVDGAVNETNIADLINVHVTRIGPGSALFGNENTPQQNLKLMQKLINSLKND